MTDEMKFKRLVRQRMDATGETYAQARTALERTWTEGGAEAVKTELREARDLIRRAARVLERAMDKADDSASCSIPAWAASVATERLRVIAGDLGDVLEGDEPVLRVEPIATGKPWDEDAGGGFGYRALQALAMCREAWMGADENNAPRMEHAMAWIARAWLETFGHQRAGVVRAVLTHGLDRGQRVERLIANVITRETLS